jgi:predicted nucleotidyltransferase
MRTLLAELAAELQTTDRTLRRSLNQGLLHASRPSPRTAHVSIAERAYLRRAWPLLFRLRELLRTEPTLSLAVLFGSRARGDDSESSDVDLLVSLRGQSDPRRLASRLSERLGLRAQLVTLEDARGAPLLLAQILGEGRVLVDRERAWPALLREKDQVERAARLERRRIDAEFATWFDDERTG